ncbi:MAG: hypothetical protein Q9160_000661 [Pyrenula sp. 1 TL-2023]
MTLLIIISELASLASGTIIASAHPSITSYFDTSNSASWLTTSFYITAIIFQPLYARVSDTLGRKSLYIASIILFFVTTLWCGAAQSMLSLILARASCGLGAGGVSAMGTIIINDIVKIEYRGIYQSYLSLIYGLGNAVGAALGGLLCDRLGWRGAFYVQLPPILLLLVVAVASTPAGLGPKLAAKESKTAWQAMRNFDYGGSVLLASAVSFLIVGLNLGGNVLSWAHPIVIVSLVIFVVSSVFFVVVERRATLPIMPIEILTRSPLANLIFSNLFGTMVAQTILFNAPIFLQAVLQKSPTVSGAFLMSPLLGVTTMSLVGGFVITWTQKLKPTIVFGAVLFLIGACTPGFLMQTTPDWLIVLLIIGASTGQGATYPATTVAVLTVSERDEAAVVTTTLGLWRNLGAILGVAISSWVLQNALQFFLVRTVTGSGAEKAHIINRARKSIKYISTLGRHRIEVITAYEQALRVTFLSTILFAVILIILVLPIRLPRLGKK